MEQEQVREVLLSMLNLQDTLNTDTNGVNWTEGMTSQHRVINWYRCMYMETTELIDSIVWKHWKDINGKDDIENARVELVDIWHFLLSQLMVDETNKSTIVDNIMDNYGFKAYVRGVVPVVKRPYVLNTAEKFLQAAVNQEDSNFLIGSFSMLAKHLGMSFEELSKLYIGKNILNKFRQDNGYKDGTYKKIWDGEEDNVHMQEILDNMEVVLPDTLYIELEKKYKEVK